MKPSLQTTRYFWGALSAILLVSGCDSTGGIDASGDPIAGIDGSGRAVSAPVDGFGSIIINGETYNTDTAEFFIRGVSGGIEQQSQLEEGQFTTLITGDSEDPETSSADKVFYFPNVTGEVTFVDPISERIVILGRSIIITSQTRFDDTFSNDKRFAGIQEGMTLTVSGSERVDGTIIASYINETQESTVDISGLITGLDTESKTFMIGKQLVSFDAVPDFSAQNSDAIWLEGVLNEGGVLLADKIFGRNDQKASLAAKTIELEGRISNWIQAERTFMLGTFEVNYGENIDTLKLTIGAQVLVKGKIDNSVVKADSIELVTPSLFHDTATLNTVGQSILTPERPGILLTFKDILGEYEVNETTVVKDRQGNALNLSDLQEGDIISFSRPTFSEPRCSVDDFGRFTLGITNFIAVGVGGSRPVQTITLEFRANENISGDVIPITTIDGVSTDGPINIFPEQTVPAALVPDAPLETRTGRTLVRSELSEDVFYDARVFGRLAPDSDEFESISLIRFIVSSLDCED